MRKATAPIASTARIPFVAITAADSEATMLGLIGPLCTTILSLVPREAS